MCLILPSRVIAVQGGEATIELPNGVQSSVSTALVPDVAIGDYVLVDRGLVLKTIEPDEAEAILTMYAELGELMEEEPEPAW